MQRSRLKAGAATVLTAAAVLPAAALAHTSHLTPPTLSPPLATGLAGPLQLAVDDNGDTYIAQQFAGLITRIDRHGARTDMPTPGIDGIDVDDGVVTYATREENGQQTVTGSLLLRRERNGSVHQLADLLAHESATNPDQVNTYGFESIPPACAAQLPAEIGPASYTGQVDSNPYAVLVRHGKTYIADSGANAIFEVSRRGVRTVAVLPPQPAVVTAAAATELGLPACAVGLTYDFEPVPTDVEAGGHGSLYVSLLPGGPESPVLGARGKVVRIGLRTGRIRTVATGLLSPTGLARTRGGTWYVAELFANRISKIAHGTAVPVATLTSPVALEFRNRKLTVSSDVFNNGTVSTFGPVR